MCVAFVCVERAQSGAPFAVVVGYNAEADAGRGACRAHACEENVIAGKESEQNDEAWLGVNKNSGAFALITKDTKRNERNMATDNDGMEGGRGLGVGRGERREGEREDVHKIGRRLAGELVMEYLKSECDCVETYVNEVYERRDEYDAFHLIVGDAQGQAFYVSNRAADVVGPQRLECGTVYGLANDGLGAPGWPKVERGKAALEEILAKHRNSTSVDFQFQPLEEEILRDVLHAPMDFGAGCAQLSRRRAVEYHSRDSTGAFVRPGDISGAPDVCTKSSHVVVFARDGRASWREFDFDPLHVASTSGRDSPGSFCVHELRPHVHELRPHAFVFRIPEVKRAKRRVAAAPMAVA